ncbi:unnamed protein product, partial [Effrenium voratum]
ARPARDLPAACLEGCSLVLVTAGVPRKPSQSKKDLMQVNGGIAKLVVEACARRCPEAIVGLIVNPVNSVVPAMARLYEKKGLDPKKILGVTTLDVVRANKFVYEATGVPVDSINVPVIGGHAGKSVLPLFSQDRLRALSLGSDGPFRPQVEPIRIAEALDRAMDATLVVGTVALVAFLSLLCTLLVRFLLGPKWHLDEDLVEAKQGEACAICLEPMSSGAQLSCGHAFHLACVRQWWTRLAFRCPLCRQTHTHVPARLAVGSTQPRASVACVRLGHTVRSV